MTPTDLDAHALSCAIHARELSCVEVMQAYLARIHRVNPRFNAIVNLADDDTLLAQAAQCDIESGARRQPRLDAWHAAGDQGRGKRHRLPHHLRHAAEGDNVARVDGVMVERMKAAGCIVIGKTNMPEFGLGSHTYNNLFGVTGNAWDPRVRPAAPAVVLQCAWRSACSRWPMAPTSWAACATRPRGTTCSACGPARAGCRCGRAPTSGSPNSAPKGRWRATCATWRRCCRPGRPRRARAAVARAGPQDFLPRAPPSVRGTRIAWLGDLGGHLALEPGIAQVCEQALRPDGRRGCAHRARNSLGVDLERVWQAWLAWRRMLVAPRVAAALARRAPRASRSNPKRCGSTTRRNR